jgi:hypothetical protein
VVLPAVPFVGVSSLDLAACHPAGGLLYPGSTMTLDAKIDIALLSLAMSLGLLTTLVAVF